MKTATAFPLPVEFGRNQDDSVWISFGPPDGKPVSVSWPGTLRQAAEFVQAVNALSKVIEALKAVRADVRDPDTDTALAAATGELIDEALAALGVRP